MQAGGTTHQESSGTLCTSLDEQVCKRRTTHQESGGALCTSSDEQVCKQGDHSSGEWWCTVY